MGDYFFFFQAKKNNNNKNQLYQKKIGLDELLRMT